MKWLYRRRQKASQPADRHRKPDPSMPRTSLPQERINAQVEKMTARLLDLYAELPEGEQRYLMEIEEWRDKMRNRIIPVEQLD